MTKSKMRRTRQTAIQTNSHCSAGTLGYCCSKELFTFGTICKQLVTTIENKRVRLIHKAEVVEQKHLKM